MNYRQKPYLADLTLNSLASKQSIIYHFLVQ